MAWMELDELRPLKTEERTGLDKAVVNLIANRQWISDNFTSNRSAIMMRLSAPMGSFVASFAFRKINFVQFYQVIYTINRRSIN